MNKFSVLNSIFEICSCFLSEDGVNILLDQYQSSTRMKDIFNANEDEIQKLILRGGDEEDIALYLNVFLWKQRHGEIRKDKRIWYNFEEHSLAWTVHRHMVERGYEFVALMPYEIPLDHTITSYEEQTEMYLGFHKETEGYDDDDYFNMLINNLNVIGPKIISHKRLPEIIEFTDCIVANFNTDKRLRWLSLSGFTMLVCDLSYPRDKSWPVYLSLLRRESVTIFDYSAGLLGIRMYGDKARNELKKTEIVGGYDLLDALASS
ncbi:MAG: hypothetical protein DRI57_21785 [Deltaproteobacteria bacterium]|nr:MAG: hypothetical protein DRI57_21785 [Deltaproteobacteria bacterium]